MKTILRLIDIPDFQNQNYPREDALNKKRESGSWDSYSTKDFINNINRISCGILKLGIKKGDKAATFSYNIPEWNFVDLGMLQIGVIHVPLYPTLGDEELIFQLNDSETRIVFAETEEKATQIRNVTDRLPKLENIYVFDQVRESDSKHWSLLLCDDSELMNEVEKIKTEINPDDNVTLIYTSGTTGNSKGVMLTHSNIMSNIISCASIMPVNNTHKALSFLPLCHVFERMVSYLYMYVGAGIYYAQNLNTIPENLKEVKPHFFTTVPRLLEKVYDKIYKRGLSLSGVQKMLFFWALRLGFEYEQSGKSMVYRIKLWLANKIIFNKWREALGGNVIGIISGGAALQPRLARVFSAAQIPVVEGYGLTETSPVIAVNRFEPENYKFGTVGRPIGGVEVEIASDGEIITRGPHIMKGYYNNPDETKKAIDEKGFFHTGDIGKMDDDGFLKITGRKKEIFKTSGGKYISPQKIENKLKESPFIEQVMVIGENQKYPVALIVPDFDHLKSWCKIHGVSSDGNHLIKNEKIVDRIQQEINTLNSSFSKYEQVKKTALLPHAWSIENGELTQTQKLKRSVVLDAYRDYWEPLFED